MDELPYAEVGGRARADVAEREREKRELFWWRAQRDAASGRGGKAQERGAAMKGMMEEEEEAGR